MHRPAHPAQADVATNMPRELQMQALLDVSSRVKSALLTYVVIWLAISQLEGFYTHYPLLSTVTAVALLTLGLVRLGLHQRLPRLVKHHYERVLLLFRALTITHIALWGCLCAMALFWPPALPLKSYMLISGAALLQGAMVTLSIDRILRWAYPFTGLTPVVCCALWHHRFEDAVLVLLCSVFAVYIIATSRVIRDDYWNGQLARLTSEERARQLEWVSVTDALTQIPNRLFFNQRLPTEWAEARRARQSVAVALIDLDHFKSINDTYGHPFGDECLRAAAAALSDELKRPADVMARYGGEEFVVLMRDTDLEGARVVAERLAERLRQTQLATAGHAVPLSCSIGVSAVVPATDSHLHNDAPALVQRADEALYEAKRTGRNRVVALPFN